MASDNVIPFPSRPEVTLGGPIDEAGVSLGIYGEDLDPDEITRLLGVSPTRSRRRGELRGDGRTCWSDGAWLLHVENRGGPEPADAVLDQLLGQLPTDPSIWASLAQRYRMRIFFYIGMSGFNKGFGLSADNIRRVAALGVRLDFDLYVDDNFPPELEKILGIPPTPRR